MRYPLTVIMGLLLTVTTVSAHPNAKTAIPGVTGLHPQKFMRLHLQGQSGQFNRFMVNHNSVIAGASAGNLGGNGNPFSMAINRTGVVSASSVVRENGKILLKADSKQTAFDVMHDEALVAAHDQVYDDAFLGTLAAKRQQAHDNQHVAGFLANYSSKQQAKHQKNHDTALHNLKIYGPDEIYIQTYSDPYSEYYYY